MDAVISISVILSFVLLNALIIKKFHKKQESLEDFAVGGRSFPWFLSVFGFIGSWYVGTMYTGSIGDAANIGLFAQYMAVYSVGTMITMYIMIKPVWTWGKNHNLQTNADLATLRYNNKYFGLFIAVTTFLFWSPWLVIEIKALGYLFNAATYNALGFNVGMIIVGLFVICYSFLGGARASLIGDLVQGLFFTIIGTAMIFFLINRAYGGVGDLMQTLAADVPDLLVINDMIGYGGWSSAIIIGCLGGMMMPGIFIRLYMAKSVKETKKSVLFVPFIGAIFTIVLFWLGMGGSLLEGFPEDAQSGAFWIADTYGGPFILGIMGICALAACMSTISGASITAGTMIARNFLGFFNVPEKKQFIYSRYLTLLVGMIAIGMATLEMERMIAIVLYVYNCISQVAVPLLFGLFWKRGNVYGAFVGTTIGMLTVLLYPYLPWLTAWAGTWSAGIVALLYNFVAYVVVSLFTPKQTHVDELFSELNTKKDGVAYEHSVNT